ncbi:MAG: DNA cytosine methyltransferase [Candidatus Absconditabacterales bacterium]
MKNKKNIKVVDLFCGIGGLTHGFVNQGFNVVAGIDFDPLCKYAFEKNNNSKFLDMDIKDVKGSIIKKLYGKDSDIKILVGCAPCQPFSLMNTQKSQYFNNEDVELKSPIRKFADLIKEVKPEIVSMENVAGLIDEKKYPSFSYFINTLEDNGYKVSYSVVDCTKYGIPQTRRRLVLLASRYGEIKLIPETHKTPVTVRETIGKLSKIKAGEISKKDNLHRARDLNDLNKRRLDAIPKNGGSLLDVKDQSLIPECHKKDSGKTYLPNVYARMRWDKPAPTMTTWCTGFGNGRFGHPEQNRAISLREASLFQTFPMDYEFFDGNGTMSIQKISKQIGNAVPVRLGEVIAESIKKHLTKFSV